jgi:Ca2+-binding RTX toxin-like protein
MLFGRSNHPHATATSPRREARLDIETLEERAVPATVYRPSITFHGDTQGNIRIEGTKYVDKVTVTTDTYNLKITDNYLNKTYYFSKQAFADKTIYFSGYDSNDQFENRSSMKTIAWGGAGDDVMIGGHSQDIFDGEAGNDKLYGGGGKDFLMGNTGNDYLDGSGTLYAGVYSHAYDGVADYLHGGTGADKFKAEWIQDPSSVFVKYKNLDAPADFNSLAGDTILNAAPQTVIMM